MMKSLALFALILTAGMSQSLLAKEVFKIKKIHFEGNVYSGALIASEIEEDMEDNQKFLMIRQPRVLVYGAGVLGLDKVFELDVDNDNSESISLCMNLGYKYTEMIDAQIVHGPVAHFVKKDEVVIGRSSMGYSSKRTLTCSNFPNPTI